mmetsp:Transcript_31263/g.93686  ORF Transcript_31263/g.93686 Transcript_31263/m.93686 type:complete len:323 (-) Transcript_31263:219-1187(-)
MSDICRRGAGARGAQYLPHHRRVRSNGAPLLRAFRLAHLNAVDLHVITPGGSVFLGRILSGELGQTVSVAVTFAGGDEEHLTHRPRHLHRSCHHRLAVRSCRVYGKRPYRRYPRRDPMLVVLPPRVRMLLLMGGGGGGGASRGVPLLVTLSIASSAPAFFFAAAFAATARLLPLPPPLLLLMLLRLFRMDMDLASSLDLGLVLVRRARCDEAPIRPSPGGVLPYHGEEGRGGRHAVDSDGLILMLALPLLPQLQTHLHLPLHLAVVARVLVAVAVSSSNGGGESGAASAAARRMTDVPSTDDGGGGSDDDRSSAGGAAAHDD